MNSLTNSKSRDVRRCVSIPIIILTLIVIFGNCITTTSYYPDGIENKTITNVDKSKLARPRVNLKITGNMDRDESLLLFDHITLIDHYEKVFLNDQSSPIDLTVSYSINPSSPLVVLISIYLPSFLSSSITESIQYGTKDQSVTKKFEITRRIYLPIPFVSYATTLFFGVTSNDNRGSNRQNLEEIHERFVHSLREEIAKIAPLADPDSETPQTADLPTTFNDIVVLKNGDILEGVHTKVTPTTLEVTESNGKKTIYKKSQVLSVKKK